MTHSHHLTSTTTSTAAYIIIIITIVIANSQSIHPYSTTNTSKRRERSPNPFLLYFSHFSHYQPETRPERPSKLQRPSSSSSEITSQCMQFSIHTILNSYTKKVFPHHRHHIFPEQEEKNVLLFFLQCMLFCLESSAV